MIEIHSQKSAEASLRHYLRSLLVPPPFAVAAWLGLLIRPWVSGPVEGDVLQRAAFIERLVSLRKSTM